MEELAINGGKKVKESWYGFGRRFDNEELEQLKQALMQNTLFYWNGKKVKNFCKKFSEIYGVNYCMATSSGTAAVHCALGALEIAPGDEVITTPITDMGTVIGILYQNAVPVFADVDPHTYNIDPKQIESKITEKTKAIIVVHLSGNPADIDPILKIAKKYNLFIIEDCAQSYMSYYRDKLVGTFGDIGCFSTNDNKHITTGEGGLCITNNETLYHKLLKFTDKNYNRISSVPNAIRQIKHLAPNYRMTELQAAVGIAQLDKIENICNKRNKYGTLLTEGIKNIKGIYPHKVIEGSSCSYYFYMFRINEEVIGVGRDDFCKALAAEGIPNERGFLPACVYESELFLNKSVYPNSACPFNCKYHNEPINYAKGSCPIAEKVLSTGIKLPVSEFFTKEDLEDTIKGIKKVADYYTAKIKEDIS